MATPRSVESFQNATFNLVPGLVCTHIGERATHESINHLTRKIALVLEQHGLQSAVGWDHQTNSVEIKVAVPHRLKHIVLNVALVALT